VLGLGAGTQLKLIDIGDMHVAPGSMLMSGTVDGTMPFVAHWSYMNWIVFARKASGEFSSAVHPSSFVTAIGSAFGG